MFSRYPWQMSEIFKPPYSPFLHFTGYLYPFVLSYQNNANIPQRPCFSASWKKKTGSINMKMLLQKVKYLELTHGQPQGDSEKAKPPTRCKQITKKKEYKTLYHIYFSSCPRIPYGPNSKSKWTLWAHKYFTSLKINVKAILSFLYPSNAKQLLVSVHLTFLIRLGVRLCGFH